MVIKREREPTIEIVLNMACMLGLDGGPFLSEGTMSLDEAEGSYVFIL